MHKCDTCQYKGKHQEMGFKSSGVCRMEHDLLKAMLAYRAPECPFAVKEEKKTKMTDQEKLVRLIDEAADITPVSHGGQISYYLDSEKIADHLIAHGVTVKEPQKPLTVEEIRKLPEFVWVEWKIGQEFEPKIPSTLEMDCVETADFLVFTDDIYANMDTYGVLWRCWAEKPTEEERKAAEWD